MLKISLRSARINANLSQVEAAKKLNVSNKTLCHWEKGKSFPSPPMIDRMCKLYNVSYDNLKFIP